MSPHRAWNLEGNTAIYTISVQCVKNHKIGKCRQQKDKAAMLNTFKRKIERGSKILSREMPFKLRNAE